MEHEEWRPIPGFPGYEASNLGRVLSRQKKIPHVLKASTDRLGYLRVSLRVAGGKKTRRVHQCVAAAFLGPRPAGLEVRHLNGDQLDNSLPNLMYGTHSENVRDAIAHGTFIRSRVPKTHCVHGHEYTAENTSTYGRKRYCRTCWRLKNRRRAASVAV